MLFGDYLMSMMTSHLKSFFQRAKWHVVEIMKHLMWLEAVILGFYIFCSNSKKVTITGQFQGWKNWGLGV